MPVRFFWDARDGFLDTRHVYKMDPSQFWHMFQKPVLGTHNPRIFFGSLFKILILSLRSQVDTKPISGSLFTTQNFSLKSKTVPSRLWHIVHKPILGSHNPQITSWLTVQNTNFDPKIQSKLALSRFSPHFSKRKTCPWNPKWTQADFYTSFINQF